LISATRALATVSSSTIRCCGKEKIMRFLTAMLSMLALFVALASAAEPVGGQERRLLYVATPGIRNYVEYGGIGIIIFDIDNGHRFVKRIPTWQPAASKEPENVKGIAASAKTGRLYVSTYKRLGCFDLLTEKMIWEKELEGGCDRMAISPDGSNLYVPSFE